MKKGGQLASGSGFTIVETMIVLAVSAMLFVIAGTMITGRQAKTEFQVATKDIQTKVQQIINETKSGYYGSADRRTCSSGASGLNFNTLGGNLGTNGDCVFVGKALVAHNDTIYIYSLAGLRNRYASDEPPQNAAEARTTVIPDSMETYKLPYGTKLVGFGFDDTDALGSPVAFAIITSFESSVSSSVGSQSFGLHSFARTFSGLESTFESTINSERSAGGAFPSRSKVKLCIQSGGTDQSLKLTIGGDNSTTVSSEVKSGGRCGLP